MKRTIIIEYDGLSYEDYYESSSVKKGKSAYYCQHCKKVIPVGTPSSVHKFYPEFNGYRTHIECSQDWFESIGSGNDKVLEPATTDEQKAVEEELFEIIQPFMFNFHEAKVSGNADGLLDYEELIEDEFYSTGKPFKTSYTTNLGDTINFEIRYKEITYEIC